MNKENVEKTLKLLSYAGKIVTLLETVQVMNMFSPNATIGLYIASSVLKDSVNRIGDFLDDGKLNSSWRGTPVALLLCAVLLIGTGCTTIKVPPAEISAVSPDGLKLNLKVPQDVSFKELTAFRKIGTNEFNLKITGYSAANNPDVIGVTAQGQALLTQEHYKGAALLTEAAIKAGVKAAAPLP